jgi:hypothetical protein
MNESCAMQALVAWRIAELAPAVGKPSRLAGMLAPR